MSCTSGCPTPGAHESWGACLRAKNPRVGDLNVTANKQFSRDNDAYRAARKQGIQPQTTQRVDVERAVKQSDKQGFAVT